jgi:hypothetical protein
MEPSLESVNCASVDRAHRALERRRVLDVDDGNVDSHDAILP